MKGFKVVSTTPDGKHWSAVFGGECSKEYLEGEFVRVNPIMEAKGYGLTFFTALEEARMFLGANKIISNQAGRLEVWNAEAKGLFTFLPFERLYNFSELHIKMQFFIAISRKLLKRGGIGEWPFGTRMARQIKLIWRIS